MIGTSREWVTTERVEMLVFDGVKLLDVACPSEVFGEAKGGGARHAVTLCSPDGANVNVASALIFLFASSLVLIAGGERHLGWPHHGDGHRLSRYLAELDLGVSVPCAEFSRRHIAPRLSRGGRRSCLRCLRGRCAFEGSLVGRRRPRSDAAG
jgi:hypothetical protein